MFRRISSRKDWMKSARRLAAVAYGTERLCVGLENRKMNHWMTHACLPALLPLTHNP